MSNNKTITDITYLYEDAGEIANYDVYIKTGDIDNFKSVCKFFFQNILTKNVVSHAEIKANFTAAIHAIPRNTDKFQQLLSTAKCILGDDLFTTPLNGEYVLLNSRILEIALLIEPEQIRRNTKLSATQLRQCVKTEFIDDKTKKTIIDTLKNIEFGRDSMNTAESVLNRLLGPRWTIFATLEEHAPLHGFTKPAEYIHFCDNNSLNVLVAHHPLTLDEAFENLSIDDITAEIHGNGLQQYSSNSFKEVLIQQCKGLDDEDSVIEKVKCLFKDKKHVAIIFGHTVTTPTDCDYALFTIKRRQLLIVF